jgi:methylated-DNA-[protein]-cysteine S-methyltransferase
MLLELSHLESPVGRLLIAVSDEGLHALEFSATEDDVEARVRRALPGASFGRCARTGSVHDALRTYFSGNLTAIDDLPAHGSGTPFQQRVWATLRTIPAGRTTSYRAIAAQIGRPSAVRAVGAANGQNPVALVVPCHRVIASDGTLCGYGGGLWRKEWLLRHEHALLT